MSLEYSQYVLLDYVGISYTFEQLAHGNKNEMKLILFPWNETPFNNFFFGKVNFDWSYYSQFELKKY